ncbi:SNARE-complex protein Syntaxin-18 N-terminal [Penicillium expansum]|uniref:SNARE-complex protein Syntaxin-18 N-terminal n=1 Tax=Penicillium expansum TaxID=27334 RepID=A0A0A2I606_PENEN|nr:SNARE-complex protein Syntaxin-18 N-terminal [Penicillium expansum]KGO38544.1 SNARE-complex protein Syntaxin-18 N-terminal [Penicillium expansum]KGO40228.1 SNARE-complex protein Syntaxin-18 N-terminal [Penicillium expansum]KGO53009.1 SNARE-complex protein Syntaxin-18 N-terminal [Penicillium expansum]
MTDLTPTLNNLLSKQGSSVPQARKPCTETADEFLKEAYRINSHIHSLLQYLQSIRHAYLSTTQPQRRNQNTSTPNPKNAPPTTQTNLTDPERDAVDTSTALLLRDLATSIANLSSAESLRQETSSTLLHKKYGHSAAGALLWRWAGGSGALDSTSDDNEGKSAEQVQAEESARSLATIRESVLWFLRRGLESAVGVQRRMVEKRIERVREKEKSVLYKVAAGKTAGGSGNGGRKVSVSVSERTGAGAGAGVTGGGSFDPTFQAPDAAVLSEADTARIEAQLSPEQLQLFAEENDSMLRHYEDTLGKVQNAEKSLLEISSLQETLVSHLATQEEHISQLISDVDTTQTNVGQGNRELKRATERRSTAQAVFWGTVGLCTWLVVWDLVF